MLVSPLHTQRHALTIPQQFGFPSPGNGESPSNTSSTVSTNGAGTGGGSYVLSSGSTRGSNGVNGGLGERIGKENGQQSQICTTTPKEVINSFERYQQLLVHENHVIQQLRACDLSSPIKMKNLGLELNSIMTKKLRELRSIIGDENQNNTGAVTALCIPSTPLVIEEQPTGNVVANKYLEPPLVIRVDKSLISMAREGRLQVLASLCVTLSDAVISRTLDNKQDILQGHTIVPVSADGYAAFNKLKIMEVSSKHHHQSFSIQLQLQEIRKVSSTVVANVTPIGDPVKSAPLHVQSRINKRKRSCSFHVRPKKRSRGDSDCNYADITSLLVLPQKEAATRLGISESMLCKRFKECTRRKWPYRYLRKIDKMIRVLTPNKKGEPISREDLEKIKKLKREREECLHPVKIRITGHDKTPSRRQSTTSHVDGDESVKMSDSDSEMSSNSSPYEEEEEVEDEEEEVEDEDEIAQVASTLNLLKQGESQWNQ